ncbi:IS1 family transposase, partial [Enterobacter rongchengensis]
GLLSAFEVVVWMTDGWPLYESRLKGELHVISKRYTQRIERHNLNLRQHLARLGRKSLSFSKWHCCKVSDEAAFCLIQRPYISKTLLTRRISPRGSP